MDNLENLQTFLFGPLEQAYYCNFFLVLTVFGFVFFIGSVFIMVYGLSHQIGFVFYLKSLIIMCFYFIFYLQSRILYSMCSGTLTKKNVKEV
jgi:hypothetical protein